jgi:hypothetical protein
LLKIAGFSAWSPVVIYVDDLIVDPYESKEEDEQKLR